MAPHPPATRKLWSAASVVACVVAFSGCGGCDENILNLGGTTLTGPDQVDPGAAVEFTVAGGIGDKPFKCPVTVQMSYVEVDDQGRTLNFPAASKGKITELTLTKKAYKKSTANGCVLRKPVKLPINISAGRKDQHRVKMTVSLHGPGPKAPPSDAPFAGLAQLFSDLSVGEDSKFVTVKGKLPPPNQPPVADFITSQSPAKTGEPLGLDGRLSRDDGAVVRWEWDLDGNGTYEKSSFSPTAVRVDSAKATNQTIKLRVTDNRGAQAESKRVAVTSSDHVYTEGAPTLSPEIAGLRKPVIVGVRSTSPSEADRADLTCDTTLTSTLADPDTGETFPQRCTFATAGFKPIAVKYTPPSGNTYTPTTFFRLAQIVPGARSATRAATTPPLSVPLTLTGGTIKRLGRMRLQSTSGTVRGLIATGSGRGKLPKGTPKRFRSALRTLASGRFAVLFNGSGKLEGRTINLSGSATMLVRSRRSRKTQMCLSVKAAGGGGQARFSVRGATGKVRGFAATGTGPPISFAKGTGRTSTVSLVPRKGKARRLSRTCRSLSKVLDGKKLKTKKRKSKSRKR